MELTNHSIIQETQAIVRYMWIRHDTYLDQLLFCVTIKGSSQQGNDYVDGM